MVESSFGDGSKLIIQNSLKGDKMIYNFSKHGHGDGSSMVSVSAKDEESAARALAVKFLGQNSEAQESKSILGGGGGWILANSQGESVWISKAQNW